MASTTVKSNFGYSPVYSGVTENGLLPLSWSPVKIVTTTATAGGSPLTLTANQVAGGLVLLDPQGAMTATMPTAAELYKEFGSVIGQTVTVWIKNTADASETITIAAGTGITANGTMTIAQNHLRGFKVVITSPTTATAYNLGTHTF
jgi:hypothetical protein